MTEKSLYCSCCNYQAKFPSEFNKHLGSQKHSRKGIKKDYKCDNCEYFATTHWNLKMHCVLKHYTLEQKKELKYYCKLCDNVNFSNLYYQNHMKSTLHKNNIMINEMSDETLNDIKIYKQTRNTNKTNNPKLIKATKITLNKTPNMLLKDFLSNLMSDFDKLIDVLFFL
jgi:hypothetical protein